MHAVLRRAAAVFSVLPMLTLVAAQASAQSYPAKPITFVVPFSAGGSSDVIARLTAEKMGDVLGQRFVIENVGGAGGAIALARVAQAAPDGYTVTIGNAGTNAAAYTIGTNLKYTPQSFLPVGLVTKTFAVLAVKKAQPAATLAEFLAYAKANPGKLSYASSGNGSLQHVTGAMLAQQAGIEMTHVPYKGTGPALQDLLGAQVDLTFGTPPPFMSFIQAGKLRALAVTGKSRLGSLPNVPTAAEAGLPKLDASSWFALYAPAKTPQAVVDKLSSEINKIMATPAFKQKAAEQGAAADYMGPQQLADYGKSELARWGQVVKTSKIEAD